jgi:hypothetical protein
MIISGIYKLTFRSGNYYIGKSNNIDRRWSEHFDKFSKGKAAKNMQAEYFEYGYPSREVIWGCHSDHLDIVETYFINNMWSNKILNTTRPPPLTNADYKVLLSDPEILKNSTASVVQALQEQGKKIKNLSIELDRTNLECDYELDQIKKGTKIPKLEKEIQLLKRESQTLTEEVYRLKHRGFFSRLFNL